MAEEYLCEFADGPLNGRLNLEFPIEELPSKLHFPVTAELKPHDGNEAPVGFVEYEKREDGGTWKYFHVRTDVTAEAAVAASQLMLPKEVAPELSAYTAEQLVHELVRRETFAGVIVYAVGEVTTKTIAGGSSIAIMQSKWFEGPVGPAKLLQLGLDTLKQQFGLKEDKPPTFVVDGIKTLPLFVGQGRALEAIPTFASGRVRFEYVDPAYEPPQYSLDFAGEQISNDPTAAIKAVKSWSNHLFRFVYYVQFKDDKSRNLIRALHEHTKLVTTVCDSRLGLDPTEIWAAFDGLMGFEAIHADYRADLNRSVHYKEYAEKVEKAYQRHSEHSLPAKRLIDRMVKQIELKRSQWKNLPPIMPSTTTTTAMTNLPSSPPSGPLKLFYSYSSNDEDLRLDLEKHLKLLERNGVIEQWHFRKIPPGREWEGEINKELEAAHIILLLMSADFLFSNYCWEIEARRALERHHQKLSTVIPVIIRACDWEISPLSKLQGLPKNALAVTSWPNRDEAFTDVAKGIRRAVEAMQRGSG